nr:hypothetical protein [Angustibacter aerolatus]
MASLSSYEAHPVGIMEAVTLGLPVVGLDVAGTGDLVEDGLVTGIPGDATPDQVADALADALVATGARGAVPHVPVAVEPADLGDQHRAGSPRCTARCWPRAPPGDVRDPTRGAGACRPTPAGGARHHSARDGRGRAPLEPARGPLAPAVRRRGALRGRTRGRRDPCPGGAGRGAGDGGCGAADGGAAPGAAAAPVPARRRARAPARRPGSGRSRRRGWPGCPSSCRASTR